MASSPRAAPLPHQYCGGVVWFWPQRALYQNTALSEDSWVVGQEKMPALLRALGLIHGGQGRTPHLPLVTPTAGVCWCRWAGLGATQPLPLWPQGSSVRVRRGHRLCSQTDLGTSLRGDLGQVSKLPELQFPHL